MHVRRWNGGSTGAAVRSLHLDMMAAHRQTGDSHKPAEKTFTITRKVARPKWKRHKWQKMMNDQTWSVNSDGSGCVTKVKASMREKKSNKAEIADDETKFEMTLMIRQKSGEKVIGTTEAKQNDKDSNIKVEQDINDLWLRSSEQAWWYDRRRRKQQGWYDRSRSRKQR